MRQLAPPVPERFDDLHWAWRVGFLLLGAVLVVFWVAVLTAVI